MSSSTDSPSNAARFPTELCLAVVDAIGKDFTERRTFEAHEWYTTLKSCALVHRTWRFQAQFWLFHTVTLARIDQLRSFEAALHARPDLAKRVNSAHFQMSVTGDINNGMHITHEYLPLSPLQAFPAFSLRIALPSLRQVTIARYRTTWNSHYQEKPFVLPHLPVPPQFPRLSRRTFSSVTSLTLNNLRFPNFSDTMRLLSCFNNIEYLYLGSISWDRLTVIPGFMRGATSPGRRAPTILQHLKTLKVF